MPDVTPVFIAITRNGWAKSSSENGTLKRLKSDWGSDYIKKYGYVIYSVHPDSYCEEVNGAIVHPSNWPPVKILDKRVNK